MVTELLTTPELAVYGALRRLGIDFQIQTNLLGGRQAKGGAVADFLILDLALIISVIGEYFHSFPEAKARDRIQRISLETAGYKVIYITALNALKDARFYVEAALRGIQHEGLESI